MEYVRRTNNNQNNRMNERKEQKEHTHTNERRNNVFGNGN